MRAAKRYGIIAIALLVAAYCIPRKIYLSPAYDVAVADSSGRAIPKQKVWRFLEDYSHGSDANYSGEEITDSEGRTHFDAVTDWISFATESFGCLSEILQSGAHASCGSHVDVSVDANHFIEIGRREEVVNGQSHLKSLTITLTPCPSGDWHTCAEAVDRKAKPTSPGNR
jgi:hypothetical protein